MCNNINPSNNTFTTQSNKNECGGGSASNSVLYNLDNEWWQPDQNSLCHCNSYSGGSNKYTVIYLTTVITGIKTIVFTSIPETNLTSFPIYYAVSNTPNPSSNIWIAACSANCFFGTNDFTVPLTIGAFMWNPGLYQQIGICEIWAYQYKNYIPGSLITASLPGLDSNSASYTSYSTNQKFVVLEEKGDSEFDAGGNHTCIYNKESNSDYLAYIVVDFPSPLKIYETLQMSGKTDYTNIYLIDPSSSLMSQNASTLVATAKTLTNQDIANYPNNEAKLISRSRNVISISCVATECTSWGATRIIFAPNSTSSDKKDFFICGMAVMAELTNCTKACYNPILMPLDICPANLTVAQASSNITQNFLFPNDTSTLDLTCNPVSPICNQTFAHTLKCIDCNTCNNTVTCSGTACSTNYTSPPFDYTISQTSSPYNITIVDNQTQIINHFCKIVVNMTSQRNISQTNESICGVMITVNPCPLPSPTQCNLTKLGNLVSPNCPSDLTIPLGTTLQSNILGFRFPDSISTLCYTAGIPYVCDLPQSHVLQCVTCTDTSFVSCTTSYTVEPPFPYNIYHNTTTNKYQLNITGNQSGVFQRCKINATMFGGLQMQQSTCTFKVVVSCPTCNTTVFTQSYVPSFTNPIAIGATGQTRPFSAFNDTVSTCGTLCVNQRYSIYCLDVNGTFQTISTVLSGVSNTFNTATYPNFTLEIKTTKQSLNGKSFTCMLNVISLAIGSTATMNSTENFTLSFSLCNNSTESCPLDTWSPNPSTWVKPTSINVFLDGTNKTATFNYSTVESNLSITCNISNYCGTSQYQFQQVSDSMPVSIPGATIYPTVDDPLTKTLSLTVSTTDINSVGITKVKVFVILNSGSANPLNYSLSYFNITIANPCTSPVPCQYTNLINPGTIMSPLTIYLDNQPANQDQQLFNDTVSYICYNYTQICPKTYKLVYTSNGTQVPFDLADLIGYTNTTLTVKAATFNTAYVGTWNVQVKCSAAITSAIGNAFDIIVVACDPRSCKFTQLISPPAVLPSSFQIGVDNVQGSTNFSSPQNTVGNSCISNTSICGEPQYQLLYAVNNTSPSSFTNLVAGSPNQQTAATSNISLSGVHTVYIQFVLNLTQLDPTWGLLIYNSSNYNITIDKCSPLPCNYNYIYYPNVTNPIMPNSISVITNNTVAKSSFSDYSDDVSARCSPSTGYVNMCGNKTYIIEYQNSTATPTGTPLPFLVPVVYNATTSLWDFSITTSNNTLADTYKAVIHVQFATPTDIPGNLSDNMTWPLTIILEVANPCVNLNCSRRALVMNRIGYLEPQNFTIDVLLTKNYTLFDSYNDTKTQSCFGLSGSDINGTNITSWLMPCCSPPLYQLVDAATGVDLNNFFGPLIQINWYQQAQFSQIFKLEVSTNFKSLVGDHIVKLAVRLFDTDQPQYSQNFTITVFDPCNPPDCGNSSFIPAGQKPTNININIGDGYIPSNQGTWKNSIDTQCQSITPLCGKPQFELLQVDGSPVPFDYFCVDMNGLVQVFVIITDEKLKGQTFDVILVGYGYDNVTNTQFGKNGTSDIFKVIVGLNEVVNPYQQAALAKPIFTIWPQNKVIQISENDNQTLSQQFFAEAYSIAGIQQISVDLQSAFTFLSYNIQNNDTAIFTIKYDKKSPIGTFKISVTATDKQGLTVKNTFTITFVFLVQIDVKIKQKFQNLTDPLIATIESISNSGFMTISYNKRVVPITNVTWISQSEFKMIFQQNSDEEDQTEQFRYQVISMTPDHIFVQLNFSKPLDVSQGIVPDKVQVYMLGNLFMVEDTQGIYSDWTEGQILQNQIIDINQIRNQENFAKFENITVYTPLNKEVPKQIGNSNEAAVLQSDVNRFRLALQVVMWLPLATHWVGFGQMEYTWVIFTNLQLISTITQFDLKLPVNLVTLTQSFACISNGNFLPSKILYLWYRRQGSPSDTPNLNIYGNPNKDTTGKITSYAEYVGVDDRVLNVTNSVLSEFEQSRFYGQCYSDRVIETAAQFILTLFILFSIILFGFILKKSFLTMLPLKFQEAYFYLQTRIFWCFPLRMLIQQYMLITFSAFINLKYQNKDDTIEHQVNRAISIVILIFYSIGFVLFNLVLLYKYRNHLQFPDLFKKFGTLWLSIEIEKKKAIPQVAIGLIRKFLLMTIAVFIPQNNLQFCTSLYVQEIYTIYILVVKPMNRPGRNFIEYFNEITLLILIILLAPLTDYVTDTNIRLKVGTFIIYIIYFQLSVNGLFLILDMKHSFEKMYKTLRYKLYMERKRREWLIHIKVVDEIDRYKMTIDYNEYKRKNPLLEAQLSAIEEEVSQKFSTIESIDLEKDRKEVKKVKSISQRQREFKTLMAKLEAEHSAKPQIKTPVTLGIDGTQLVNEKLKEKLQDRNDWPVSPRLANKIQNEINFGQDQGRNQEDWGWKVDINSSKASDWDALPKDYVDESRQFENLSINLDSQVSLLSSPAQSKKAQSIQSDEFNASRNNNENSLWRLGDSLSLLDSEIMFKNDIDKK